MIAKKIAKVWVFGSNSSDKRYETLQYVDNSTSCNCMGWTRRCVDGQRSCRHTRSVDMGLADQDCITSQSNCSYLLPPAAEAVVEKKPVVPNRTQKETALPVVRKIQW